MEIYKTYKIIEKKSFSNDEIKLIAKNYKEHLKYYESCIKDNYITFLCYFDIYTDYFSLGNEEYSYEELINSNLNQLYNEIKKYM